MPQDWKDKYVGWFIAEDGVFGGSTEGVFSLLGLPSGPVRTLAFELASAAQQGLQEGA